MIVYLLFLIILFLLFLIEVNKRQYNIFKKGFFSFSNSNSKSNSKNIEYFDGKSYTGPLKMLIQVDDEVKVFFRGSHIYTGSGWNRAHNITVQNANYGDKIHFRCYNGGGPGGFIGKFNFNGVDYYSNKSNVRFIGRVLDNHGTISGSKYMGCYNDRASRDLPKGYGYGFSIEQCAKVTAGDNLSYYALQDGSYCSGGNSFGKYGISDNCNKRCTSNSSEYCGGGWANKVYSKTDEPETIELGNRNNSVWSTNTDIGFGDKAKWLWVKNGPRTDDYAIGWWECYFQIPIVEKLSFCANPDYKEFNPAACYNPSSRVLCEQSVNKNYHSDPLLCKSVINKDDSESFFLTINKVFKMLIKIDNIKNFNDTTYVQLITRKLNENNQKIYGADFIADFINSNLRLINVIMAIAEKIKYPLDEKYITKNKLVEPNSPQYYELIRRVNKWSNNNKGVLSKQFNTYYTDVYKYGRIIAGSPLIVESCTCLFDPNDAVCTPCNSTKEIPINFPLSTIPKPLNSDLITPEIIQNLFGTQKDLILLYKGSSDGFTAQAFHTKCDNQGATLTVIRATNGRIGGGYTPTSWRSANNYINVPQGQAFIFSVSGNSANRYYNNRYPQYSMYDGSGYGPTFGGGHDIYVPNNSNSSSGYTNTPHSYDSPSNTSIFGSYNFTTSEIEVFKVN
jgi:cell fate (sporulation/competence/biofilm development) regulator YlbF (YheA/YmcA/DUF963 family)